MTNQSSLRVADLPQNTPTPFELRPSSPELDAIKQELGLLGLRKVSFVGSVQAQGKRDWVLTAKLGATVIQPCVITLDPVTTRIDVPVRRMFLAEWSEPDEPEFEMPEDDETEALGPEIDPAHATLRARELSQEQTP